jgi:hypothetical protein
MYDGEWFNTTINYSNTTQNNKKVFIYRNLSIRLKHITTQCQPDSNNN